MTKQERPACRLHGLLAARAPVVCVLRRGPTDWFHIARWDVLQDTVEHGAWLHATMYPLRCGISPDGALLAAFIRDERRGLGEWHLYFAVSKLPWLRALAAWSTMNTYTTGAHFHDDGTLVLAGTVLSPVPFHGQYPGEVILQPTDVQWTRAGLFQELHSGWVPVERTERWLAEVPAPIEASHTSLVITRTAPVSAGQRLALVSLWPGAREYYLVGSSAIVPLHDVAWAEWHPQRENTLLVATRTGVLRLLTTSLEIVWEYDMKPFEPEAQDAPAWAARW